MEVVWARLRSRCRAQPQGDAFEEFVRGRSAHLFRLALALRGWNDAAAEDLLQIALERAYRRRRQLFRDVAAEPYVRRVLVNAAIDWRRGLRRRGELPLTAVAAELIAEDGTAQVADRDLLVRALKDLPPRQRGAGAAVLGRSPGRADRRPLELQRRDGRWT